MRMRSRLLQSSGSTSNLVQLLYFVYLLREDSTIIRVKPASKSKPKSKPAQQKMAVRCLTINATNGVGLKRPRSAGEESESSEEDEPSVLACTRLACTDGAHWNRSVHHATCGRQRKVQRLSNPFLTAFLALFEDDIIQDFLWVDSCAKLADKYLLAMVYVYFRRASVPVELYTRLNFFLALYLANDIEEDNEDDKYEIFPWALGVNWMTQFPAFLLLRDQLWHSMGFRAVVSKRTCEEVMAMAPTHCIWQRSRLPHHGGALRSYLKPAYLPRYGRSSPTDCEHCRQARQQECVLVTPLSPAIPLPPPKMDLLDQIDCAFDPALYNAGYSSQPTAGYSSQPAAASRHSTSLSTKTLTGLDLHEE